MPKGGKVRIPTALVTMNPFSYCPACGAGKCETTSLTTVRFQCGMEQIMTDGDEFAIRGTCPYAMAAVEELRARKIQRTSEAPPTISMIYSPDEFAVGDAVQWASQSAGTETVKKGVIVAVVPPEAKPDDYIPDGMRKNSTSGYGKPRNHTTYLIQVQGKGSMVYWPRVHVLRKCE